jgi:hypothetical protein
MPKGVTYSIRLGWGKNTPTTVADYWKKCIGKMTTGDLTELITFSK